MKAVIFDMDGVIIDSPSISDKLLAQTAKKFGVHFTEKELHNLHGISFPAFWEYVKEKHNLPETAAIIMQATIISKKNYRCIKIFYRLTEVPALLKDLKKHNIRLALASSASRYRIQKILDLFHMEDTFEVTVSYQDVTHAKPDPEIFLKAAEKLKIKPEDCVVIEDAVNGFVAASKAGMKCVLYWVKTTKVKTSVKPSLVIDDFTKLDYAVLDAL